MLLDKDLPGVFRTADRASLRGQSWYLRLTLWRLLAVMGVALGGFVLSALPADVNVAVRRATLLGVVGFAAVAFLLDLILQFILQPERDWYAGRAVAESVKTLAWRFSVCADPFPESQSLDHAREQLLARIGDVVNKGADRLHLIEETPTDDWIATDAMIRLREESFEARRQAYIEGRIRDQQSWYARKAKWNANSALAFRILIVVIDFFVLATLTVLAWAGGGPDLAALLAACVAAITAWMSIKQFSPLASAYRTAAKELALIEVVLKRSDPDDWAATAGNAEEAISREHTMWLASRGQEKIF